DQRHRVNECFSARRQSEILHLGAGNASVSGSPPELGENLCRGCEEIRAGNKPVDLRLPPGAASARLGAARLAQLGYRNAAAAYEVTASQIATHSPSDKSNITIKEAAVLSRGARSSAV